MYFYFSGLKVKYGITNYSNISLQLILNSKVKNLSLQNKQNVAKIAEVSFFVIIAMSQQISVLSIDDIISLLHIYAPDRIHSKHIQKISENMTQGVG